MTSSNTINFNKLTEVSAVSRITTTIALSSSEDDDDSNVIIPSLFEK